jgi:hypothetical protein
MAKSKIIFVNDEKKVDKQVEQGHNKDMGKDQTSETPREFSPVVRAYVPYFNEALKLYEMFTVHIDPVSGETRLERTTLKHDSQPRAAMEMQKLYSDDYIKRLKEQHKKETGKA